MDLYHIFYFFVIYAFLGWCSETTYATIKKKEFINRGFLNGPFCPIYGFGAVSVLILLIPIIHILPQNQILKILIIVIYASVITSILEYITGYLLETFFNTTWWDYSCRKFNIKGRICLRFSIIWGIVAYINWIVVHPKISYVVDSIPRKIGDALIGLLLIYFFLDGFTTVKSLMNMQKIMLEMKKLADILKEELKVNIYEFMQEVEVKKDKAFINLESIKKGVGKKKQYILDKTETIINTYLELSKKIEKRYSRFFKAFPNVKSKKFAQIIKNLNNKIKTKKS